MEKRGGWGYEAEFGEANRAKLRDEAYRAYERGELSLAEAAAMAGMLGEDFEEHVAGERGLL